MRIFVFNRAGKMAKVRHIKAQLSLFFVISIFQAIDCSAIVSVELVRYSNPQGTNVFGSKCDEFPGGKELACDPSFHFCMSPRPRNSDSCIWTGVWQNRNTIDFRRGMEIARRVKNPLLLVYGDEWEGEITLNIVARDEDGLFDDQMDMFKKTITLNDVSKYKYVTLKGEISNFTVRMRLLCSRTDSNCLKHCEPRMDQQKRWVCKKVNKCVPRDDDTGHYECDDVTGKKKCLPGWADESTNCKNDIRSEVSCSVNYMRIDIDRKYFDPAKYSAINLLDSSCKATISRSHITLDSIPQQCGSNRIETDDYIVYENEVYMKATPTDELITREHDVRIKFKCSFNRSDVISSKAMYPLTTVDVQPDAALLYTRPGEQTFSLGKASFSIYTFNIRMYKDKSFKQIQNDFPVAVSLNNSLYFEVNSTSNDDNLVLLIDRCFGTPRFFASERLKYTFIENGCPKDKTVTFFDGNRKRIRFGLNSFSFIKRSPQVFIHCIVMVCRKSSTEAKCTEGCNGDILHRARRDAESEFHEESRSYTKYYMVNIGPITENFTVPNNRRFGSHAGAKDAINWPSILTIVLVVAISVLGLVAIGMFIKMMRGSKGNGQRKEGKEEVDK